MTNDLDRVRARFERWARREWPIATLDRSELDGDYMVRSLQDHWTGWQAAIAAAQADESERDIESGERTRGTHEGSAEVVGDSSHCAAVKTPSSLSAGNQSDPLSPYPSPAQYAQRQACAHPWVHGWADGVGNTGTACATCGARWPYPAHPSPAQCAQEQIESIMRGYVDEIFHASIEYGAAKSDAKRDKATEKVNAAFSELRGKLEIVLGAAQCAPAQPVAWMYWDRMAGEHDVRVGPDEVNIVGAVPLYAHPLPPPVPQQPVTLETTRAAYRIWWRSITKAGDPNHRESLSRDAFDAGASWALASLSPHEGARE